jgi:hypothetical protein
MDKNKLRKFYDLIVPEVLEEKENVRILAIRKKEREDEDPPKKEIYIKCFDEFSDIIKKYRHHWNLFITLSTVKDTNDGLSGKTSNMLRRQVLFVDFDKKDYPQFTDIKDFTAHVKSKLPMLFNHAIIDSANGYHFYYAIKTSKDTARIVKVNKFIAQVLGADLNAVKPTQIARIPMSLNLKGDEPKPVSVVVNTVGTPQFKPYTLKNLEKSLEYAKINMEIDYELKSRPAPEFADNIRHYCCIESMLTNGAIKGERNFCLGRITKHLQMHGYLEHKALQVILDWNQQCDPPKSDAEVEKDFKAFWNSNYVLTGCNFSDVRKQAILNKYCDRENCNSIVLGELLVPGEDCYEMNNKLLEDRVMRKLRGNHYLILSTLHLYSEGITLKQIKEYITPVESAKPCLDDKTLRIILLDLIDYKFINKDKGIYSLKEIANHGLGFTRLNYLINERLIEKKIKQQEYLVYIALNRNLQQRRSMTYDDLAYELDMDRGNLCRYVKSLHKKRCIKIDNMYNEKGIRCNIYKIA